MTTRNRMRTAGLVLAVAAAAVVNLRVAAQGERPPDIAGEWRLDSAEDPGQPPLGDYLGIAFNEAGRLRADTTPESIWGTPEYQCRPHSAPHQWRGVGGARILKEQDPISREIVGYHIQFMRSLDRPIFMDGRPHPPAWAPHSWSGFSTGEWVGNTLKVTTTHLKDGYLKRGGPQTSDMLHDDGVHHPPRRHPDRSSQVVDDPIYLDEPYVQSTTYTYDPTAGPATENCNGSSFAENGGTRSALGAALPARAEQRHRRVPEDAELGSVRAGARRREDDLSGVPRGAERARRRVDSLTVPSSKSANDVAKRIADQSPRDGQVHVLPVQGNVYMLVADGTNITASVGTDGIALVNTGSAQMSDKVLAALDQLAQDGGQRRRRPTPASARTVPAHGAGRARTSTRSSPRRAPAQSDALHHQHQRGAGARRRQREARHVGRRSAAAAAAASAAPCATSAQTASIVAHENVLNRDERAGRQGAAGSRRRRGRPRRIFDEFHKLSEYVNGEAVIVYHAPAANTDGDSFVFFRHSEVISAGNLFSTVSYPLIDIDQGRQRSRA